MMLTTNEAAAILGVTPCAIRVAIRRGRLAAKRVGRDWWIKERDLRGYAASRQWTNENKGEKS